jgi:hypothetical protein
MTGGTDDENSGYRITLPCWQGDSVPAFVLDQAHALKRRYGSQVDLHMLAPHDVGAAYTETIDGVTIHRFRYFFPESLQKLVYPAILPNLRRSRWLALQVPFFMFAELLSILRFIKKIGSPEEVMMIL